MAMKALWFLLLSCSSYSPAYARDEARIQTITRDVAIIGGGSGGTYAAIQLQKLGKSVALIETLAQLGGNVNTYVDPTNGEAQDVGVIAYEDYPIVANYLNHLKIPFNRNKRSSSPFTNYADFKTGSAVNPSTVSSGNLTAALEAYETQLHKYPYLTNGFNLPAKMPSDFFLSWADFIKKYKLQGLAYTINTYNQGVGNVQNQLALYMLKYLDQGEVKQLLDGITIAPSSSRNQQIYDAALNTLGSGAFVSSNVTSVRRTAHGVQLVVATPHGKKIIRAKQLVIAIRPLTSALEPFLDLRPNEQALFSQWNSSFYWCGLVTNTGLPKNFSVNNADPHAPYGIPSSPCLYTIQANSLTRDFHTIYFSSPYNQSDQAVQSQILATIDRVRKGYGYPAPSSKPKIAYWRSHRPFFLTVSEDAIRDGFYTKLEALQGQYRTHWTGAAWQTEDSTVIWNYTQAVVIPNIMRNLGSYGS